MPRPLVLAALLTSVAAVRAPIAAQTSERSCTATGAAAVPAQAVPGLAPGPHTLIVQGVRLWYCVAGSAAKRNAPPVLFLHGGPGQGSYHFAALTGPALESALRMVYFDQRGSGRSERPWTGAYDLSTLVEDIEALRQTLRVPRLALLAHSFAGALALEYAASHPERVSHMVLFDAISDVPASGLSQCEALAQADPAAYARSGPDGGSPATPADCRVTRALSGRALTAFFRANMFPDTAQAVRLDSVYAASGLRNTGELSGALFGRGGIGAWRFTAHSRLTMPVLVIAGAHDRQVGLASQQALAERLPRARLLLYEGSGHYPNLDEPARFARDVITFLTTSDTSRVH